ncbi:MAG: penicillin-binding transpeptidase domain-containing protein [Solirubrobacteraceae bacterium]|nr:penicillin-binding transpeptidase domain-containing protein [Solirubrobacteraceae bacterium]
MISPLNKGASQGGGAAPAQNQAVALRVAVIGAVLLGLFAIVFFRLWYLQVLSGDSLAAAASKNRSRTVAITAPRGNILDRKGNLLVRNRRAQIVSLSPGSLPMIEREIANQYGLDLGNWGALPEKAPKRVKGQPAPTTPIKTKANTPKPQYPSLNDPDVLREYADSSEPGDLAKLKKRYEDLGKLLQLDPGEVRKRVITNLYLLPYAAIPLRKQGAQNDVVNYIAENADLYPGVTTASKFVRSYPVKKAGAQLFGQVGPVPVDEDGKVTIKKYEKTDLNKQVGLSGLELEYNGYLSGVDGKVLTKIDAYGNVQGDEGEKKPIGGDNLQLTLDRDLMKRAQSAMGAGSKFNPTGLPGAAIAMDPRNGEILASVSNPSFDPAMFVRGISEEDYIREFQNENSSKPLFNRVTDGAYPAASTFKPVTAFAMLDSGKGTVGEVYQDNGKIKVGPQTFTNAGSVAHGGVDLTTALQVSSDTYFYVKGIAMNGLVDPLPLASWARKLGYGRKTGVDLPSETSGNIPDRSWRKRLSDEEAKCRDDADPPIPKGVQFSVYAAAARGCGLSDMREWSVGDNIQLSVGQGDVQVTPLQTAVMYSAIQNGGTIVRPHLAKALQDRFGATRQTFRFKPERKPVDLEGTGGLEAIRNGLYKAANEGQGTSAGVFVNWPKDRYPLFGKTGTAERGEGREDQSWYAAYVNDPKRPIVVVVTVERGGFGAATAAPIAGEILKKWYGLDDVEIVSGGDTSN